MRTADEFQAIRLDDGINVIHITASCSPSIGRYEAS